METRDHPLAVWQAGEDGAEARPRAEALEEWSAARREALWDLVADRGAVLLRGYAAGTVEEFERLLGGLGASSMQYRRGTSPRSRVRGGIYTSTDAPKFFPIPLHNEMSYTTPFPSYVVFYCETPPRRGGRTPLSDSRATYRDVPDDVRRRFEERGVTYDQLVPWRPRARRKKSWRDMFGTDDPGEAERACREMGIEPSWSGKDLRIRQTRPAAIDHPRTGDRVWFNQANVFHPSFSSELRHARKRAAGALLRPLESVGDVWRLVFGMQVSYGDGSPIPRSDIEAVRRALWKNEFSFAWQRGDFLLIDNVRISHGRRPFRGSRRILAALLE